MSRLVRPPKAFVRALQISRVALNVFVEGHMDSYFYGQICRMELPAPFGYTLHRSDQLGGAGQGKSHLIKTFESMRRRGLLVLNFKGQKSAALFFVDKDVDDWRRTCKKSMHLVYTQYYEVENYIFRYGKLITAVSAACLRDASYVERAIPHADTWPSRAAALWSEWLKLCLIAHLLKVRGVCNFAANSQINAPGGPVDFSRYSIMLASLEATSGLAASEFVRKYSRLATRVDKLYLDNAQDAVFKGKWYKTILADELKGNGIAAGSMQNGLAERLTHHMLQSLDFSEPWADYHRKAVRAVAALTR